MPSRERREREDARRFTADKAVRYYARRPFRYTEDLTVDPGQIVELRGVRNDDALVRLGFFEALSDEGRESLVQCGVCGHWFLRAYDRERHGDRRHRATQEALEARAMGAGLGLEDTSGDAEERRLEREAPLYWDKTRASQR